jgi:hypothetical protein
MKFFLRFVLPSAFLFCLILFRAQSLPLQTQTPATPAAPNSGNAAPATDANRAKPKLIPSFLIIGTVFDEKALSFPGVQVRVRRDGEKKFGWETYTDSRGEFAVRVPPGYAYEVVVRAKKYKDQTKSVDGNVDVQQRLSIQLQLVKEPKTGAKS